MGLLLGEEGSEVDFDRSSSFNSFSISRAVPRRERFSVDVGRHDKLCIRLKKADGRTKPGEKVSV